MTFPTLPAHLQRMVLFAVNTGLRDSNVCGLEWSWEVFVPEVGRSVFAIPTEAFKTKRAHVVIGSIPPGCFRIAGITGPPIAGVACSRRGRSLLRRASC